MTNRFLAAATALLALALPATAHASLQQGSLAPQIAAQGAMAGRPFTFDLRAALRRGPVVLYFFPKAFTHGCTLETKAFADAHDRFARAGATVIGMSADKLPVLLRFSTEACRSRFGVASATPAVIKAYDVDLGVAGLSSGMTERTSYVIDRRGRIAFVHTAMDWRDHVKLTLAAVEKLRGR
jgi:Peroxiredoxin